MNRSAYNRVLVSVADEIAHTICLPRSKARTKKERKKHATRSKLLLL